MSTGILIVDDSPGIRSLIRKFVESSGYSVCGEAEDGLQAIERAKQLRPDLVLLDLSMPMLNGAETASVLKSTMPGLPVVLFTMFEFGETLAAAVGVNVVLCKVDGLTKLADFLRQYLGDQSAGDPP